MQEEEWLPLVDEEGNLIGKETRRMCHGGSMKLHPVVHIHIFNSKGELYLQKRSMTKDIQPGKWDTSVGGHIDYGETIEIAAERECREELGVLGVKPQLLYKYLWQSNVERELVYVYNLIIDDVSFIKPDGDEVSEGRFWTKFELAANMGKQVFTPNFEFDYQKLAQFLHL